MSKQTAARIAWVFIAFVTVNTIILCRYTSHPGHVWLAALVMGGFVLVRNREVWRS